MDITEVRIKLTDDPNDRLKAFCSMTLDDCFVVRDLKVIEGSGGIFVAMPSRKIMDHCSHCGSKNHLRAVHCNECGKRLPENDDARVRLYADVAHPINAECREMIQARVLDAFEEELREAQRPDYHSRYDDVYAGDDYEDEFDNLDFGDDDAEKAKSEGTKRPQPLDSGPAKSNSRETRSGASSQGDVAQRPRRDRSDGTPRGPHKKPAAGQQPAGRSEPPRKRPDDAFGAGIF